MQSSAFSAPAGVSMKIPTRKPTNRAFRLPSSPVDRQGCPHARNRTLRNPHRPLAVTDRRGARALCRMRRGKRAASGLALALVLLIGATPAAYSVGGVIDDTSTASTSGQLPPAQTYTPFVPIQATSSTDADRASRANRATRSRLPTRAPLQGRVSAAFGSRGHLWSTRHTGIDISARYGTAVRAVATGRVVKVAYDREYGRTVVVRTRKVDVWYAHLASATTRVGRVVRVGQGVGKVGTSGNVTGPHLHLEVRRHDRPTDPATFLWGPRRGIAGPTPRWARTGLTSLDQL